MNNDFYENIDKNFDEAYKLCNKSFTHEELLSLLKNGNIPEKQIAALCFDNVENKEDAFALINNLTGCDGKIREAVAYKIRFFIYNKPSVRVFFDDAKIFADATIDINGNICRAIVDAAKILIENKEFSKKYIEFIIKYTFEAFDELDKFIFRDKKYVINKQIFKLYWCLETIKYFQDFIEYDTLLQIINKSLKQKEYTIREKVAQIVVNSKYDLQHIKKMLKNDDNYYVKQAILEHPCCI